DGGVGGRPPLFHPRAGEGDDLRVRRGVPQPDETALFAVLCEPYRL
ncbi:MAG: hypothetical protein AVDCRST_MAG02-1263, partial [uncultured Rubrobacteraceae bacterium]